MTTPASEPRTGSAAGSALSADYVALSLRLEKETGYDSIPTIERVYEATDTGRICCVWPGCKFRSLEAEDVWRHVHFGKHGLAFGVKSPELIDGDIGAPPQTGARS